MRAKVTYHRHWPQTYDDYEELILLSQPYIEDKSSRHSWFQSLSPMSTLMGHIESRETKSTNYSNVSNKNGHQWLKDHQSHQFQAKSREKLCKN